LVYIHGFMGNETSFQSFPAHVHNLVTVKLAESHVVHTKIYPKYKSRKQIEFARDAFSEWLRPHEGSDTDVVLLGHSMGGILSAEVALLENHRILGTVNFDTPFLGMHPGVITSGLGSIFRPALDSPLPKPTEAETESQTASRTATNDVIQSPVSSSYFGPNASSASSLMPTETNSTAALRTMSSASLDLPIKDPNYDPPFVNDVRLPQRSGWANALHFINKHSDGLTKATQSYVMSHLEFGGAMADYNGLKRRYEKVRALENGKSPGGNRSTQVRFVNYYTASTGRPKKPKEPKEPKSVAVSRVPTCEATDETSTPEDGIQSVNLQASRTPSLSPSSPIVIKNAVDETLPAEAEDTTYTDENFLNANESYSDDGDAVSDGSLGLNHMDPAPIVNSESDKGSAGQDDSKSLESTNPTATGADPPPTNASSIAPPDHQAPNLRPVPPAPEEPPPFNPDSYPDKDTRKLAEKDHARLVKTYKQATKDRDKAISERRKFLEKREKNAVKEREKQQKADEKERLSLEQRGMERGEQERAKAERETKKRQGKERAKAEKEAAKKAAKENKRAKAASEADDVNADSKDEKPKRDRKFCMLPPKINGEIDPCWVRVFMPGVDEVGAHCGLFFVDGERYQRFVADVAEGIERWVEERRE